MDKIEKIDCTTCKYGYEDERLGIPMCHHPKRFSEDCVDFNMHEEKHPDGKPNKSLEEAALKYAEPYISTVADNVKWAFKAGAEWQASQMPMPEDTVLFQKGVAEGRRLEREDMLKEAVEGEVIKTDKHTSVRYKSFYGTDRYFYGIADKQFKPGDKVRIVVLKEEEE